MSTICDKNNGEITAIKFILTNPDFFVTSTQSGKVFICDVNSTVTKNFCTGIKIENLLYKDLQKASIIFVVPFTFTEPKNEIYSVDVTSNGAYLATAGRDATLRIYDTRTNKVLFIKKSNTK